MLRVGAFLLGLAIASIFVIRYNRTHEHVPQEVDLTRARAAFLEGDVEACKGWAKSVAKQAPPPVDWLLEGLEHDDRNVREWSAHILGDVETADERVVDALLLAFEDEDDWVRWKAARALGNIGPRAHAALPALLKAAHDVREEVVQAAAIKAVAQIRGEPYEMAPKK